MIQTVIGKALCSRAVLLKKVKTNLTLLLSLEG